LEANGVVDLIRTISSSSFIWPATFRRRPQSLPIVYFVALCGGYIQMAFFLDFYCLKILDIHLFFKLSMFGACKGNIL
jgi:hypothetical protein